MPRKEDSGDSSAAYTRSTRGNESTIAYGSAGDEAAPRTAETGEAGILRWALWLGVPFVASAALFAAAIGTGSLWFMGLAWFIGPELIILAYIYLSLTSDSNAELELIRADGAAARGPGAATHLNGSRAALSKPSVICVSHATGSGGEEVGRLIAAGLDYRYVDDEIIVRAAEADHAFPEAVSLAESGHVGREISVDFNRLEKTKLLRRLINEAVVSTADEGGVVIVGHAASFVLCGKPGVLRVRMTGSPANRLERLHDRFGFDPESARRLVKEADADQAAYLRHAFAVSDELPTDYDVVLNTDRIEFEEAAAMVVRRAA